MLYEVITRIKMAAMMHHERCDGSGYPMGLRADQIDPFAKIVRITSYNVCYTKLLRPLLLTDGHLSVVRHLPGYAINRSTVAQSSRTALAETSRAARSSVVSSYSTTCSAPPRPIFAGTPTTTFCNPYSYNFV